MLVTKTGQDSCILIYINDLGELGRELCIVNSINQHYKSNCFHSKKARDSHNASPLRPCKRLPTKCLEFCALVGLSEASKWGVHLPLGLNAMQDIGLSCAGKCAITPSPSESSLTRTWNIYTQKTHNKATVSWRSYTNKIRLLVYLTSQCFRHIAGH